jgi:hypothetical protein
VAAGNTYESIATTTLGSNQNTVTFSSISGTYTDLVAVLSARSVSGAATDGLALRVNSDSSALYSTTFLRGDGGSASSGRNTGDTYYRFLNDVVAGSGSASGTFGATILNFQNYSNTTTFKTIISRGNLAVSGTQAVVGLYRSTNAITSISFIGYGGDFVTGSTFSLYGIKSA